MVILF